MLLATYAYAVQIYCDFSGYTDIAIGLALLMGFVFPQNFDRPYRAASFGEFWRRWHMTLSRFLRDFLYIPLGGDRRASCKTVRNLMVTMLLGGLWHGAAWGFVLWGAIHGIALVVEHQFRGKVHLPRWLAWLLVFHIVALAWIPFRAPDLSLAGACLAPGALGHADPLDCARHLRRRARDRPAAAARQADGRRPRALRGPASRRAGRQHGRRHRARHRHHLKPRRATVHLLPVLSTESDTRPCPRRTSTSSTAPPAARCALATHDLRLRRALLLIVVKGQSIRSPGEKLDPGVERTVLLAVGHPAGWVADRFGVDDDVGR